MNKQQTYDRIESYLMGEMDAETKARFEKEMAADPDLKQEFEQHAKAHAVINHGYNQTLKARLVEIDNEESATGAKVIQLRPVMRKLAIAASITLLVGVAGWFWASSTYSHQALAANMLATTEIDVLRSDEGLVTPEQAHADAEALFTQGDFDEAGMAFSALVAVDNDLSQKAEWNLLMCHLAQDDLQSFQALLQKILDNPDHDFHKRAQRVAKKMEHVLYRMTH